VVERARSIIPTHDQSTAIVVDPDPRRRQHIVSALSAEGCDAIEIASLDAVLGAAEQRQPQLAVLAFSAASASEVLALAARLRQRHAQLPIVVVVRGSTEAVAIAALRAGATDYLIDPFAADAVAATLRRCRVAGAPRPPRDGPDPLVGSAPALLAACAYLDRAARTNATVLITGETGTGKELAAQRVHRASGRPGRFVPVNCAAIPDALLESELFGHESGAFTGATHARDGLLQLADRGTVFLDEVGDMEPSAQAKILRAIEKREVFRVGARHATPLDVRVVAATNQDLEQAVDAGRFRKDLFFRLNVVRVHLPPLRERRCDIPAIVDHYLRTLGGEAPAGVDGFAPQTLDALVAYDWPGNVRELRNLIESVFVAAPPGRIRLEDLPPAYRERLARYCALPDAERARVMDALLAADWNKSRAAEMLQWSRMTLYRKMAKYSVVSSAPAGRLSTDRRGARRRT
jgi:DNA-binding NtrC family response regulator